MICRAKIWYRMKKKLLSQNLQDRNNNVDRHNLMRWRVAIIFMYQEVKKWKHVFDATFRIFHHPLTNSKMNFKWLSWAMERASEMRYANFAEERPRSSSHAIRNCIWMPVMPRPQYLQLPPEQHKSWPVKWYYTDMQMLLSCIQSIEPS